MSVTNNSANDLISKCLNSRQVQDHRNNGLERD